MLDTNIVSGMAREVRGSIARRIASVGADSICVSIVTAAEIRYGVMRKGSKTLRKQMEAILGSIAILPLEEPVDAEYASIRCALEIAGQPIGPNDLFIAAHAKAIGAVLVTANTAEFTRVSGLQVENWLS